MAFRQCLRAAAAAGLLLLVAAKARAQMCSAGLYVAVTAPRDGEGNVPTNAVVAIRVAGDPIPAGIENQFGLRLAPSGGTVPASAIRLTHAASYIAPIRLTPPCCLFAQQVYEVVRTVSGSTVVLATFTTGSGQDFSTSGPPPPSGASATVDTFDLHPDGGSDCVRDRIRRVRLTLPDAGQPVLYSIQENGQTLSPDEPSPVGIFDCSGQPQWTGDVSWVVTPGQHTIQLSAVSRTARTSSPVDVSFNASCTATSNDGGNPGQGGTGEGGGRPAEPTNGCSCQNGTAAALALGALGLILRARSKRSKS